MLHHLHADLLNEIIEFGLKTAMVFDIECELASTMDNNKAYRVQIV